MDDGTEGFDGAAADTYSLGCLAFFTLRGYVPYDWETAMHRDRAAGDTTDSTALVDRLKANDPFGGPSGGSYDSEDDDDEDDDEDDVEEATLTALAIEFVRWATRYEPGDRPSARALGGHAWLASPSAAAAAQDDGAAVLESALGQLGLA